MERKIEPGNVIVVYVYDATGLLAGEYTNLPSYSSPCVTPCYLTHDHLGSLRMVTDQAGNLIARHDYLPFGEEVPGGSFGRSSKFGPNDGGYLPLKFTGQLRDGETGLDYFGARYYGSAMGRFTSADDGSDQDPSDPQSWNLYSYVRNNPLKNIDPSGQDCITTSNQRPLVSGSQRSRAVLPRHAVARTSMEQLTLTHISTTEQA